MKGFSGFKSPLKKDYDFSGHKPYTGKGTVMEGVTKNYTDKFKTIGGTISEIIPLGKAKKAVKVVKGIYDHFKS